MMAKEILQEAKISLLFQSTHPACGSMILMADGRPDIFIGGRSVPGSYGVIPRSVLFKNNGNGIFTDVTNKLHLNF
jgi:hypothetical protein